MTDTSARIHDVADDPHPLAPDRQDPSVCLTCGNKIEDRTVRTPYWEGRRIPMWAPCTDGAEDLICPCGNSVMSGGFQPLGMKDHIEHNTEAPVGEVNPSLWGLVECQDCLTVFDNDQQIMPYSKSLVLQPLPWMRVAQVEEYPHRIRILWMSTEAKQKIARYFPRNS